MQIWLYYNKGNEDAWIQAEISRNLDVDYLGAVYKHLVHVK